VIPVEDMVSKIKVAVETRSHSDFQIVARTLRPSRKLDSP
jgi:2-methylisocitrate lyase-like PEP mutase family enzyme